jgi:PAS domain S-box-containing protein
MREVTPFGSFGAIAPRVRFWCAILGILLCADAGPAAAQQPSPKNVLFVFSTVKYSGETRGAIEPYMQAHVPGPINFYYAYLDDPQSKENPYWATLAEGIRRKYAAVKMDVVIADVTPSLLFAVKYRDKIFPGVPIVFVAVNQRELEGQKVWPGVTGVTNPLGFRETIDLALRLQPDTEAIAVLAGLTNWDSYWLTVLRAELAHYQDRVKEIDLVGTPDRQMLERVSALPPHTVVIFQTSPQYSDEPDFGAWDLVTETAHRVPTYSVWPRFCVNGCIGGVFENPITEWTSTADLATRILSGQSTEDLPIVHSTDLRARVDWRALQRWHIPDSALPLGSEILNREPTFWQRYRNYVIATVVLIVLQTLLICGLLWQRARKRKVEAVLRESERRFRVMADTTPSLIWMCDEEGKVIYQNDQRVAFTGPDPNGAYGDSWTAYVHPDDLKNVQDALAWALKSGQRFSKEYRLCRHDGIYRWMLDIASPRVNGDGSFAGFIGSAIDITDQKLAQEALETVGGRLIEAQEEERRRIARELHDDISQKLALLAMELTRADYSVNGSPEATKERLKELQQYCSTIAHDVQTLSHQLHNSRLDYLGLAAALKGFCKEFGSQYAVRVEFKDENVPGNLPRNISLCLFRVAQEALHNAVKYSGAKKFAVELTATRTEIQLLVTDPGAGFDTEHVKSNPGLGLVSMQERVHMVQGRFHLESKPGEGTKIIASAPLINEDGASSGRGGSAQTASVPGVQ